MRFRQSKLDKALAWMIIAPAMLKDHHRENVAMRAQEHAVLRAARRRR